MATIKEIAKMCDVSIATVSNILNGKPNASEETRARVLRAVESLNYRPNNVAQNLKNKSTRAIGVIVEDITVFCTPDIIDGITAYCEERGYHILLTNLRLFQKYEDAYYFQEAFFDTVNKEIRELLSKQVDGIIYVTSHERIVECLPKDLKIPAVMAYGYSKSSQFPSVVVDDINGAYSLVDYMIKKGHKKIGVISGKENSIHTRDRLLGYQKALFDNNIFYNPEIVSKGDWTRDGGYFAMEVLLKQGVTAVFCMNDLMAGGAYDRLEEVGLKPGIDISVGGFDNREIASYYKPALTTVELPLFEIGRTACKMIIEHIDVEKSMDKEKNEEARLKMNMAFENEIVEVEEKCRIRHRDSISQID